MILAVDVDYKNDTGLIGGVIFDNWADKEPKIEVVSKVQPVEDYTPGEFYKRELPCILELMNEHSLKPDVIVVDGYVFLDGEKESGLGKHLYDALGGSIPVVGVAKNRFKNIGSNYEVYRGKSDKPLYVTAAGLDIEIAKQQIINMDGGFRFPTLLKRVDKLCRAWDSSS
tara:strand:+ start:11872 stop:12381 length:510 start_codon:yes stop_codon:yes gene_type:complete